MKYRFHKDLTTRVTIADRRMMMTAMRAHIIRRRDKGRTMWCMDRIMDTDGEFTVLFSRYPMYYPGVSMSFPMGRLMAFVTIRFTHNEIKHAIRKTGGRKYKAMALLMGIDPEPLEPCAGKGNGCC